MPMAQSETANAEAAAQTASVQAAAPLHIPIIIDERVPINNGNYGFRLVISFDIIAHGNLWYLDALSFQLLIY